MKDEGVIYSKEFKREYQYGTSINVLINSGIISMPQLVVSFKTSEYQIWAQLCQYLSNISAQYPMILHLGKGEYIKTIFKSWN